MLFVVGLLIVIASVGGGYIGAGGRLHGLFQPFEFIFIFGAVIGWKRP
jgi:chemotaxis protein MotA